MRNILAVVSLVAGLSAAVTATVVRRGLNAELDQKASSYSLRKLESQLEARLENLEAYQEFKAAMTSPTAA